ncbi:MAG: iron-sulfur cluster repair protein YtfE [Beijerinckiaceae bacterium]|jgi:regulator of cell morphogenesis and NO signaling|nr:iron-sulfur cluster repair protein YtfE [Beijerinckiaceae bacterium]
MTTTATVATGRINPDATVGEIAASLAGATAVFRRHKIDFCCGGNVSLDEAAAKRGVDPELVRASLANLAQTPPDAPTGSVELVAHIIARYHDTHRAELPELVRLSRRVEAVHRDHPEVPAGLADTLAQAAIDLEDHMKKEEQILFPAICDGFKGALDGPIMVMRHEHDDHARTIRALQTLTHSYEPPMDACRSWQALYNGVEKLVTDLTEHIHLENNVLFPRFQSVRAL